MLFDIDFVALAKAEPKAKKRLRYLALAHFQQGHSRTEIAKFLKVGRNTVNKWVSNFLAHGLPGLEDKSSPGRPAQLSQTQLESLSRFIQKRSENEQGGRLTGMDIQRFIEQKFGVTYEISNIYRLLRMLGFAWITSRSKHPQQSQGAQDAFKKLPVGNDP